MDRTTRKSEAFELVCPTCGAVYAMPRYVEGQRYGCKRCSASLLFGKFALLKELGRGGFGVVYKAFQVDLERVVALKFLHSDSEESTERFIREARIAAQLNHPNIATIHDVGQNDGKLFISMQFIDGLLCHKAELPVREAVQVIRDASLAVDYAHARDIVHRDIKPHNVMVAQERSGTTSDQMSRRTYVMDFGLARSVGKDSSLTVEGQVLGTPAFMSPEQAEARPVDYRSDVYSLGATLYSLVTRRPPFEAPTPLQVLMMVSKGEIRPPSQINPQVDRGLEGIILKSMALKPEDRYPSAGRFAGDLSLWLQGVTPDAGPTLHLSATPVVHKKTARAVKGRRGLAVAALAALVVAGLGAAAGIFLRTPSATPPAPPVAKPPDRPPAPPDARLVLEVVTDPPGATLRIAGRDWPTPAKLTDRDLGPGEHEVEVFKANFVSARDRLTISPGQPARRLDVKLDKSPREVAFRVDSEPRGARATVNGLDAGPMPVTVHVDELADGVAQVGATLKGFGAKKERLEYQGQAKEVKIALAPLTGTFLVRKAQPKSRVTLVAVPPGVRNARALVSLWSESPDSLERALKAMDPQDAPFAAGRLQELARHAEPAVRAAAAKFPAQAPAPEPVRTEKPVEADALGNARIEQAWVSRRYRILATHPAALDFVSEELEPQEGDAQVVPVSMTALAAVTARMRPPLGQFSVPSLDGGAPVPLRADGTPVRVPSGLVTFTYEPPAGDSALWKFSLTVQVAERHDLSDNLYLLAARQAEAAQLPELAVRGYSRALDVPNPPPAEEKERRELPAKIRSLYRQWIEAAERKGGTPEGDLAAKVAAARGKNSPEAQASLLEVYAARNAAPGVKAAAAAGLALAQAKLKQPYEAMEWLERAVREKADPGADAEAEVAAAIKGCPGLFPDRWEPVSQALAEIRKKTRPAFLGLRAAEVPGRGLRVDGIAKGGPAEAAGVQFGDLLVELGGAPLRTQADLDAALKPRSEGESVELKVERSGERASVAVRLGAAPANPEYAVAPPPPPPPVGGKVGVMALARDDLPLGFVVKLDENAQVAAGDVLEVVRNGQVVDELAVDKVGGKEASYPGGSAQCRKGKGQARRGDEVRKK